MKILLNVFMLTLMGFLAASQTGQAQILSAPVTTDNARIAISPYAQTVPNDSYTFISVSHPSLTTAKSQVGIVLEVIGMNTIPNNAAGRSATMTINAGETHRIFIVDQGNATINLSNPAFTDSRTHLITTVNSAQFGNIRVVGINEAPTVPTFIGPSPKFDNVSQLSMWGIVFIPDSGSGFAMEFIGDAHDSTLGPVIAPLAGRGIN